jgi:2-furoyl-CoA dehydrogenase large subunit
VPHHIGVSVRYPRNAGTPIEGFVVIAEYLPGEEGVEAFHAKRKPCSGDINR